MPSRRSASPSRGAPRGRSRSRSRTPMSRSASPLPRRRRSPSRSRSRSRSYSRSRSRCYSPDGRGSRGGGGGGGGGNFRAVKLHGLTKAVHERHLKYIFGAYGDIEEVEVYRFAQSGEPRGNAVLVYANAASASMAVSHMHKGQIDGGVVTVDLCATPSSKRPARRASPPRGHRSGVGSGSRAPRRDDYAPGGRDDGDRRDRNGASYAPRRDDYGRQDGRGYRPSSRDRDERGYGRGGGGRDERPGYGPPAREDRYGAPAREERAWGPSSRDERGRNDQGAPPPRDRDDRGYGAAASGARDAGWERSSRGPPAPPQREFGRAQQHDAGRGGWAPPPEREGGSGWGARGGGAGNNGATSGGGWADASAGAGGSDPPRRDAARDGAGEGGWGDDPRARDTTINNTSRGWAPSGSTNGKDAHGDDANGWAA